MSLLPELNTVSIGGADPQKGSADPQKRAMNTRQRCEILRTQLALEQGTWRTHWQELNDNILPRRGRFYVTDVNKGDRRNFKIIDSTATAAARTCASGMMASITSPARPWFRLITGIADLDEQADVKEWLEEVRVRMATAMVRSNLYKVLPILYGDMAVFGTGAMAVLEDEDAIFRCYDFPVGSYAVANDDTMRVRTFVRLYRMTVNQIVDRWGDVNKTTGEPNFLRATAEGPCVSNVVQTLWKNGQGEVWVDLVHVIRQNLAYDGVKIESKYKKFESIYYEIGTPNQPVDPALYGLLSHSGFDEFPVLVGRWETNSEDVYATNCPGMTALGDIKQLQVMAKRTAQAVEKMLNPPMMGPTFLRSVKTSLVPGDTTYYDTPAGQEGFRPVHEVNFGAALGPMKDLQMACQERIQRDFYEDLFLMLSQSDRREITAREVEERHEEKLLALGPMLEQLNQDVLDPLIDRIFAIMERKRLLPPAPPQLQGMTIHPEYISIMAQAQKQLGLTAMERFASFTGQAAQFDPSVVDVIDPDEMMLEYADAAGVPPKILRGEDQVKALRAQRQQAAAQQRQAEQLPAAASAAKDLAAAPVTGNSVLASIIGRARARTTLNGTASPPASPIG